MTSLDKASLDNRSLKLWQAIGSALLFLDAVGGVMLLPFLPLLVQELGVESNYVVAAWTGLLVGSYYAGRSGSLAAARVCPWAMPANISFLYTSIALALSAVTYAVCGQLVGPRGLQWLALFRFLSGILAALHRILGVGCLRVAAAHTDNRSDMTDTGNGDRIPASRGFGATVAGRVMGCAVAGFLFSQGDVRPIGRLCLVWAIAHVPPALLLLVAWRRSTRSGNSRGWSALSSTDFGRVSIDSGVNDRRTEGSEIELVLSNGMGNGPDRGDGVREGRGVAARPSSPVAAPASRVGPVPHTVASDKIEVPQRYLRGCKGDRVEAERRWRLTLEWRAKERIDEILHERQPFFDVIKRHYPHYIHRRARNGCPIWIELPTRIDLSALRANGVSDEALQRHYVFVTEYLWGVVEPEFDTGQAVTILDVKGLKMRDLAGEALAFVQRATSIIQDHYVERSNRMFIVNAPSYFSLIWRIIRPMLNERTQAKIAIVSADEAKIAAALLEVIDAKNLPRQYGGSCEVELGESEEERGLREYVERIVSSRAPEEDGGEAEVDLRPQGGIGGAGLERSPGGGSGFDGKIDDRAGVGSDDTDGIARRALSRVAGAVEWARGRFQWRRSQIAHLGDENAFVYDDAQQRWVLGGENGNSCRGRRSGTGGTPSTASRGEAKRTSRKDRGASFGRNRGDSIGSDTSEEMTILAIQAAHFSLNSGATKFSPVPSNTSPVPIGASGDAIRPVEKTGLAGRSEPSESTGDHDLVVYCPCLRPLGRHAAFPAMGGVLYTVSSAIREALPVWAISEIQAGGLGAAPQDLGVAIAAGVVFSAAGRALTSAGCFGPGLLGHREEMFCAVRGRIVVVVILGMLYLGKRLAPGKVPSAVVWVALTGAVAVTQFALGVSGGEQQKRLGHVGSNGVAGDGVVGGGVSRFTWSTPWSGLVGDVFGSAIGPLILALGLRTGLPSPLDASLWFICCVFVDLLLLVQARHSGELHAQLVDADEGGIAPGREEDAHPGRRVSELV